MDNQNAMMPEEGYGDKKTDKKAAKLAKREEKARKREEKLKQRLEKAGASPEEIEKAIANSGDYEEEGGSRLAVFFVTLVIVVIWLAILVLLIKMDVGGFGSTVMRPLLKDVPYLNRILPEETPDLASVQSTENTEYPYTTLDDAVARIKELEVELQNAKNEAKNSQNQMEELQEQSTQLEQYKANEAAFEERRQKFDEEVVFSDQAPDINEYRTFYEGIEPANAEAIYKQVIEQQQGDEELEQYVSMYSSMKPKQAAAIFDTMTDNLSLVKRILEKMSSQDRGNILAAMNQDTAAKLTEMLEPSKK